MRMLLRERKVNLGIDVSGLMNHTVRVQKGDDEDKISP